MGHPAGEPRLCELPLPGLTRLNLMTEERQKHTQLHPPSRQYRFRATSGRSVGPTTDRTQFIGVARTSVASGKSAFLIAQLIGSDKITIIQIV